MVRTNTVGHIRDVRRLIVAVSRARLGLYVFCKADLFDNCYELRHVMQAFNQYPKVLKVVEGELYGDCDRKEGEDAESIDYFSK